jgi:hypothetical protein
LKVTIGNAAATAARFAAGLDSRRHARQRRPTRTEMTVRQPIPRDPAASIRSSCRPPAPRALAPGVVRWGARVVTVGGDAPVRVQAMTNTDTVDAIGTAIQVKELAIAGSEMVRITVNTPEAARRCPTSASSSTAWASTCR